ncbi:MAG: hypothetical protein K2L89_03060, partial [Muribaculaceae bacterium]|nr:hypothetical protein [Muribaculaceae bacterium]
MKSRIYILIGVTFLILGMLTSCSISSDSATEKKLIGTWEAEETESEIEDGVEAKIKTKYSLNLLPDNSFEWIMEEAYIEPFKMDLGTTTLFGEWKASKDELYFNYDVDKTQLTLGPDLEEADKREIEREMREEFKNGAEDLWEILELGKDYFTIFDDEDKERISYHRVEAKSKIKEELNASKGSRESIESEPSAKTPRKLSLKAYDGSATPLSSQGNNTYYASNLVDGNLSTAWAVDMDKNGYEYIWGPNLEFMDGKKVEYI